HYIDEDSRLKSWLENVERGSVTTASEYIRRMGHVCDAFKISPKKLGKMSERVAGDFLLKVVTHFEEKGSAGTNIKGYSRALKSWWAFNDIQIKKKVNIRGS